MHCYHCKNNIDSSWMDLNNIPSPDDEETPLNIHICGYSCYKRISESDSLPRLWPHVTNKLDFEDLRPERRLVEKRFEYISEDEIKNMGKEAKEKYLNEEHEQLIMDIDISISQDETMKEDERTAYLEHCSSDSEYYDDY